MINLEHLRDSVEIEYNRRKKAEYKDVWLQAWAAIAKKEKLVPWEIDEKATKIADKCLADYKEREERGTF